MKKIIILGATGSIGKIALDIARKFPQKLHVIGLQAHTQADTLLTLQKEFPHATLALTGASHPNQHLLQGQDALCRLIQNTHADLVLNAIAGASGLHASLYTLEKGIDLALANKESIVMAGEYLKKIAEKNGAKILPVDSEHSALFYLMKSPLAVDEYIITASGGAFRGKKVTDLHQVTAQEAMKHPTWRMGAKISIDSATLANKGLEVIEAWKLFDIPIDKINVLQHPQSLVHALIRTQDGALHAYISETYMELPIQNALLDPELALASCSFLDLVDKTLSFTAIDHETFPMVNLAYQACRQGDPYPIIYNASNEEAVALFQAGKIPFLAISRIVESALSQLYPHPFNPLILADIWQADRWSREFSSNYYKENHTC